MKTGSGRRSSSLLAVVVVMFTASCVLDEETATYSVQAHVINAARRNRAVNEKLDVMQAWLVQHPGEALPERLEELIYVFALNCATGIAGMTPTDFAAEYGRTELAIHLEYTALGLDGDAGIGFVLGEGFDTSNWNTVTDEHVHERLVGPLENVGKWVLAARPYSRNVSVPTRSGRIGAWTISMEQQQPDWAIERFAISPPTDARENGINAAITFSCYNSATSGFMQYGSIRFADDAGTMDLRMEEMSCNAAELAELLDDQGTHLGNIELCSDPEYFNTLSVLDVQEFVRWFAGRTGIVVRISAEGIVEGDWHVSLEGAAEAVNAVRTDCLRDKPRG